MANVTITQLPAAGPITGTESVPIVQNGVTVQTTTAAIAASPSLTQTFLTVNTEATLPNSRYLSTGLGLGLSDGGVLSYYRITLNRASGSLENASTGILAKDTASTVVARTFQTSGNGLSVTNGSGVSGNPTFALTGQVLSLANASGVGLVALPNNGSVVPRVLTGTVSQIDVAEGSGATGNPTFSIASDAILPGTGAMTVPKGTDAQKPGGSTGMFRYNTTLNVFEGYTTAGWGAFALTGGVTTFSGGSTGLLPSSPTVGAVTLSGTLNVASGGTGAGSLTGYVKGSGTSAFTASATIPTTDLSGQITNAQLQNSSITIGSTAVSLGGTITTFTGTSISGSTNTLSNIGNASLTNSSITINGNNVSLGGSTTVTASTTNALTFTNTGGAAPGTTFNGSVARTIDYSTVGAPKADGTGATGTWNINILGNAATATSATSATTATTATNAVNIGITNDDTTNATMYPVWVTANTGNLPAKVTSTKLNFNPSTGVLTATGGISGGTF